MKSIEHYEQLAREAKAEGCGHHSRSLVHRVSDNEWIGVRCEGCYEMLPLGPSRDTAKVLVELRAATIAATRRPASRGGRWYVTTWAEGCGGDAYCDGVDMDLDTFGDIDHAAEWEAGWLAAAILSHHDAEQAETGGGR